MSRSLQLWVIKGHNKVPLLILQMMYVEIFCELYDNSKVSAICSHENIDSYHCITIVEEHCWHATSHAISTSKTKFNTNIAIEIP